MTTILDAARDRAARIQLMIFDVDGVLTDGRLHFGPQGEMMKSFHVLDGHGIKLLQRAGIATAIISARQSPVVTRRASDLGITHVRQGIEDKRCAFEELCAEVDVAAAACGYIGDDVIDLPVLTRVGFAASVPGGHPEVRSRVHYVSVAPGGQGAVREVCDFILQARGQYDAQIASYLA